uniref:Fanconi anemia group M protein isoform X1 n=1 Tax=Solea senegalensis TaxID=28829 RepID=UPI001CD8AB78|nr:Fanconi anemia group M protein isoform X1 [Solea senegalensis]
MNSGSNQKTLFQTWGAAVSQSTFGQPKKGAKGDKAAGRRRKIPSTGSTGKVAPSQPPRNPLWSETGHSSTFTAETPVRTEEPAPAFEYEDEDDDLMVVAVYEAEKSLQCNNTNFIQHDNPVGAESRALSPALSGARTYPDLPGFDSSSAKVWIYPTNYPIREYQLKMSEAALFHNTLVCLPTGLGKTFIASVVMYNFYRWYPSGKIVFMAPTKPLVAQQIEACYKVMGIPQAHMAELTGSTAAKQRQEIWRSKRVFFLTPQVMVNDLSRGTCPAQQVKCVVIDEAHKALGNHAYCQVIRQLGSQTLQFRILALSATPGGDAKAVQSVISNLLISHIELRSEESPDIQAHSHQRSVEKMVVPLGEALSAHQGRYLQVLEKFMSRLVQNRVMSHKDLKTLTKYQLILARDQFRKNPPPQIKGAQLGMLEGDFALCISLYHGYELLMQMGLRSLFFYIQGIMDGSREMSRARNELQRTPVFMDLYCEMEAMFVKPSAGPDEPFIYSHPKLEKLEGVVLQHFSLWAESSADCNENTRVMIFSSFRESVQEIADMLNRHAPMIKVMTFMGQASAGKGVKGFTQKEQLEVVHRFRQGGFNTLVSTCVGEEGLDIGEVDLIVCFDAQKNPIRLVQRMGRTGRKRQGRIVVILAEGREERTYNQSQSNKRSVYKSIIGNRTGFHMYPSSPRMLPEGLNPTLHKMHITCGQFDQRENRRSSGGGRRSHSEGRVSLIHPQNLIRQGRATSDGFLSSAEYSTWASTLRLQEDDAHPTLKQSHFMSIPSEAPPQELNKSGRPSRELSLWEWRHWQHKVLPTHTVDHSLRCQHFVKVMELIDDMREEDEGECRYERELRPYLRRTDVAGRAKSGEKTQKSAAKTTSSKTKPPHSTASALGRIAEEADREKTQRRSLLSMMAVAKHTCPSPWETQTAYDFTDYPGPEAFCPPCPKNDSPEAGGNDDCVIINEDVMESENTVEREPRQSVSISQLVPKMDEDEDVETQAMFYLPKWDSVPPPPPPSSADLLPGKGESLKIILANVAELLSRSPLSPPAGLEADVAAPSLPPSHQEIHYPFQVSFTLGVDEDDDEEMMADDDDDDGASPMRASRQSPVGEEQSETCRDSVPDVAADSPSWDEVFGDEEVDDDHHVKEGSVEAEKRQNDDGQMKKEHSAVAASPCGSQSNESMDLFGDDEAFLQMTIPDVSTPGITPRKSDVSPTTESMSHNTSNAHKPTNPCRVIADDNTLKHDTHTAAPPCKPMTDFSMTDEIGDCKSPTVQHKAESFESSRDLFPVNFDLGYSLEESSEDEADTECVVTSPRAEGQAAPPVSNSSTPFNRNTRMPESKLSTPHMFSGQRHKDTSPLTLMSESGALPSPITSAGVRRTLLPGPRTPSLLSSSKRRRQTGCEESVCVPNPPPRTVVECNSDSEDDIVLPKKRQNMVNPLSSPDVSKISDVDSPLFVNRKRAAPLNTSDETGGEADSDDDFQTRRVFKRKKSTSQEAEKKQAPQAKAKKGRQFLLEEAELSEDTGGADVSSDEDDDEEQNHSLDGFVIDNTHFSQGLNDSEMHGVYLKSVRSPAVGGKFKMSYRNHRSNVFSQVPEMDETYAEDSFVVGSEVEEAQSSEEEAEDIELMPEDSYVDGRRQYATRRRVFLHKVRAGAGSSAEINAKAPTEQRGEAKMKGRRVIRINDSSDEEKERSVTAVGGDEEARSEPSRQQTGPSSSSSSSTIAAKVSLLSKAQRSSEAEEQQRERCRQRLENQHLLSDQLDFVSTSSKNRLKASAASPSEPQAQRSVCGDASAGESTAPPASVCILVDSRCLSASVDLMTSLRQRHAAAVHVCSLDGSYFIVSNRTAVERHSQSDLAAQQNRKRLVERVRGLQRLFERVCLIVEKDRTKPGEAARPFQRTRYYDNTLAALVRSGVRLLWSDGTEQSAGLLADLARLEQRKGQGISVPLEVKGQHREQALQLYLSLPSVSHVHALNMCHNFSSIAQLMNSSIEAIQKGGCMSPSRAEEVYRFLRYSCDTFLMKTS